VSEQPGRYTRSASGMVGALLITLLAIAAYVGFRAFNRTPLDVRPDHVDYLSAVGYAQTSGVTLVYPPRLPSGWYATSANYSPGLKPDLVLSMLTGSKQYVGLVQSPTPLGELLTTYVDPSPSAGRDVTLDGALVRHWSTWTDAGGDTALTARWHHQSLMVFGTATQNQLASFTRSLTTKELERPTSTPSTAG
jgi:hypothetical protein